MTALNTEAPTSPDPSLVNLDGFKDWLRQQPPEAEYDFTSNENCAIGLYLQSLGFTGIGVGGWGTFHVDEDYSREYQIQVEDCLSYEPRTFGAALMRLGG